MSYHPPIHPNPATAEGLNVERNGPVLARPWKSYLYKSGWYTADMSAPTDWRQLIVPETYAAIEFLVIPPAGVTSYTVVEGRWVVVGKPVDESLWVETEQHVCNGPTIIRVEANTDPAGIYLKGIQGDTTGGIKLAWRFSP
jgi:hypothetical protein